MKVKVVEKQHRNAIRESIAGLLRATRRTHINNVEADIQRYREALQAALLGSTHAIEISANDKGHLAVTLSQLVEDFNTIGREFLQRGANYGFERALRDLRARGWIKSFRAPVTAPKALVAQVEQENYDYLRKSLLPDLFAKFNGIDEAAVSAAVGAMQARVAQYSHYVWVAAEQAYKLGMRSFFEFHGKEQLREGGAGSGDYAHAGRPGAVGGSAVGGSAVAGSGWNPFAIEDMTNGHFETDDDGRQFWVIDSWKDAHVQALNAYINTYGYQVINDVLRVPEHAEIERTAQELKTAKEYARLIDESMAPLDHSVTVYRGISAKMIGRSSGVELSDKDWRAAVGKSFVDNGFVSTSTEKIEAVQFAEAKNGAVAEITIPQGTRAIDVVNNANASVRSLDDEKEVILDRGLRFRIDGIEFKNAGFGNRRPHYKMTLLPRAA